MQKGIQISALTHLGDRAMLRTMSEPNDILMPHEFHQLISSVIELGRESLSMQRPGPGGIALRPLGKTGEWISMIGLGGWDAVAEKTDEEAIALMHEAFDLGIAFWDNAWEYHEGRAEEVMGRALQEGKLRDRVFLMTKTCARDYHGFKHQFEIQLRRLRTDCVDLLQLHSIQYPDDRERIFDPENGALRAALEARQAGKIRYLGFTGHMDPKDHLHMLAAPFEWDSVQMPLNIVDAQHLSFQQQVLPECRRREIGVLGMKALGGNQGRIPEALKVDGLLCRRYSLSLPVSSLVCGLQTLEEVHEIARLARDYQPLAGEELIQLLTIANLAPNKLWIEEYKDRQGPFGCLHHEIVLQNGK